MAHLVGFAGCKNSGKDTAGGVLVDKGFTRIGFADKLKDAVGNLFGLDRLMVDELKLQDSIGCKGHVILEIDGIVEYDFDWREFLQRFGTQMGRHTFGESFWVGLALPDFPVENTVVTDCRFDNEAGRILQLGGAVFEIQRPGYSPDGHESEDPIDRDLIAGVINNDSTIEVFRRRVLQAVEDAF